MNKEAAAENHLEWQSCHEGCTEKIKKKQCKMAVEATPYE